MDMLFEDFKQYLSSNCGLNSPGKILLAISGGMDSVVMMHLFHRTGFSCDSSYFSARFVAMAELPKMAKAEPGGVGTCG